MIKEPHAQPLLTKTFLKFFLNLKLSDKTYLEIGSGDSTIFFSKVFKHVIAFEDDLSWFLSLQKKTLENTTLEFFKKETVFETCIPCTGVSNKLIKYLNQPNLIVMIDNHPGRVSRLKFAEFIDKHKQKDTVIILDNGDKADNFEATAFLKSKYYCLDFPGKYFDGSFGLTSIFFNNDNYERLL